MTIGRVVFFGMISNWNLEKKSYWSTTGAMASSYIYIYIYTYGKFIYIYIYIYIYGKFIYIYIYIILHGTVYYPGFHAFSNRWTEWRLKKNSKKKQNKKTTINMVNSFVRKLFFGLVFSGVYSSRCGYPFFSALLYMLFLLLNMSMLEELSDSLQLMYIGIGLMIDGEWFEVVCCSIIDIEHYLTILQHLVLHQFTKWPSKNHKPLSYIYIYIIHKIWRSPINFFRVFDLYQKQITGWK